jgi:hypothetical protein
MSDPLPIGRQGLHLWDRTFRLAHTTNPCGLANLKDQIRSFLIRILHVWPQHHEGSAVPSPQGFVVHPRHEYVASHMIYVDRQHIGHALDEPVRNAKDPLFPIIHAKFEECLFKIA